MKQGTSGRKSVSRLEKYIGERYPSYFIFGEHTTGNVDLADGQEDVVDNISRGDAERLMLQRDDMQTMLTKLAIALNEENPERFKEIYYD